MKQVETVLMRQLNEDKTRIPYPDFENMWDRMAEVSHTSSGLENIHMEDTELQRNWNWRKITIVASLSALLAAAPVYAAVHYDWGLLLRGRSGVQAALIQNLGQQLEQSVTRDGVTLTLHTAIVDENRTVIIYSLDVGTRKENEFWNFKDMSLKDTQGNLIEGHFGYKLWDEKQQRYNGYFESDWTPTQESVSVELIANDLQAYSQQEQELPLDSDSRKVQGFKIGRDGMQQIDVQAFSQDEEKVMFSSAIIFDTPEVKAWTYPQIAAYRNGELVNHLSNSTFGQPGVNGEYTVQQYYKLSDVPEGQTTYKLQYTKEEKLIGGPWAFDVQLSKRKMEAGTINTALNLPLATDDTGITLEQMVVTPTQIRVAMRNKERYAHQPFKKYELEVNGNTLSGQQWSRSDDDPYLTTLHFERPVDLMINEETPIYFVGKYKVSIQTPEKTPVLLFDISKEKQSLIKQIGEYQVKWTFYMQDGDLFVETESENPLFGGINQTYIGLGKDRIIGKPVTVNFDGDGNNKAIDVYKDFKGTEASIYMFYYTTDEPDKETRVQLQP